MPISNPSSVSILTSDLENRRLDIVAEILSPGESAQLPLQMGISLIYGLSCDNRLRLRIYSSAAARTSDLLRPIATPVRPGRGLLLEVVSTDDLRDFDLSPVVWNTNPGGAFATVTNLETIATSPQFSISFWEF